MIEKQDKEWLKTPTDKRRPKHLATKRKDHSAKQFKHPFVYSVNDEDDKNTIYE